MVIAWEELDTTTYNTTLPEMATWVDWLAETYRPPTQVLPPCWYAHPAILEDLSHLWTGWFITRHPLSGVGMIGLEWDARREHTFSAYAMLSLHQDVRVAHTPRSALDDH
jgi:hypothetical protein